MTMTNAAKIWTALTDSGAMCDDCLSSFSSVKPRQTVNIKCRELERAGDLNRHKDMCPKCKVTKIINRQITKDIASSNSISNGIEPRPIQSRLETKRFSEGDFPAKKMQSVISSFARQVASGSIEIYNEFSLQHELGVFLRSHAKDKDIQFERNVAYFGFEKERFEKREIDIVIYGKRSFLLDAAIELKFPRNGQYPEQMYSFCKDIVFAEQLKRSGFNKTFVVIFAEDKLFYEGAQGGIYGFFRGGRNLTGTIRKPTGRRDSEVAITGDYSITWHDVSGSLKYAVIEAQ